MKSIYCRFLIVVFAFLFACSTNSSYIQEIEKELGIKIKGTYEIKKVKKEAVGADYSREIIIQFTEQSYDSIVTQIKGNLFDQDSLKTAVKNQVVSTLSGIRKNGYWIVDGYTYRYHNPEAVDEPVSCILDNKSKTLTYVYVHL